MWFSSALMYSFALPSAQVREDGIAMKKMDALKLKIEEERVKLDQLIRERKVEESYRQSLVLDGLVEEYIGLMKQ